MDKRPHSDGPITVTVDHPERPSQDIDGQPGWLAILEANDGTGHIEAIAIGGPADAVSTALRVFSNRPKRDG